MGKFVSVGKILNFHGIKGEAKVGCSKNQQDFFLSLDTVYLKDKDKYTPLNISYAKPHKNMMLVKFDGIDSINGLLEYKGCLLFVDEDVIRNTLAEDEFLIDELVGLEVFDTKNGEKLGFVVGVSNNGATDLISIKTNSKNVSLVPFVKAIVPIVDIKNKRIEINNIEGLLE